MELYDIVIIIFLAMAGACLASFSNVAALRSSKKESFVKGRSYCPGCKATLRWFELIPVLSWIIQAGKCRRCRARISPRYLIIELTGAAVSAMCYVRYTLTPMTHISFAVAAILLAIALFDISTTEIPDALIIALIPLAILAIWMQPEISLLSRGIGFAAVSLPMLIIALIVKGSFGGGDIKLMAVCGFLLGWQNTLLAFLISVVIAGTYAIVMLAGKKVKKGAHMVFGPYLCFGVAAALLYGSEIIKWYLGLYGI